MCGNIRRSRPPLATLTCWWSPGHAGPRARVRRPRQPALAAELASHALFATPDSSDATDALAASMVRPGFGAECATWRNCYVMGTHELRNGVEKIELSSSGWQLRSRSSNC